MRYFCFKSTSYVCTANDTICQTFQSHPPAYDVNFVHISLYLKYRNVRIYIWQNDYIIFLNYFKIKIVK